MNSIGHITTQVNFVMQNYVMAVVTSHFGRIVLPRYTTDSLRSLWNLCESVLLNGESMSRRSLDHGFDSRQGLRKKFRKKLERTRI